jgi:hypothetical protein
MAQLSSELILPTGTQVVTRTDLRDGAGTVVRPRGAVGRIVAAPTDASHAYRVRFADGGEAALRRSELSIRKDEQRGGLRPEAPLKEQPRRVKPLLYVYRVLLSGIHLMRTGQVEANMVHLNEQFRLPYLPELIARKLAGPEHGALDDADLAFHRAEYERLRALLEAAQPTTRLPETSTARAALDDLLIRVRLSAMTR